MLIKIKYVGNVICVVASILWLILMSCFAQGGVVFSGYRGNPLELTFVFGGVTIGTMIALGIMCYQKMVFDWVFITSSIPLFVSLGVLVWTFFRIAAVV